MKLKSFTIHQPVKNIFHFNFKDHFKCGMMFLRYQEFYESPLKNVKGKNLSYLQLLEIYSKKFGDGDLKYSNDWSGFNLPCWVFERVLPPLTTLDFNEYDDQMKQGYEYCLKKSKGKQFYIIGSSGNKKTFNHEVAHGLYFINPSYKIDMDKLIYKIPAKNRKKIFKQLMDNQYCEEVLFDEAQAYISTGMWKAMKPLVDKELVKEFTKTFRKYFNKLKLSK